MTRRLLVLNDCVRECPHAGTKHTLGSGFGTDYICGKTGKTIVRRMALDSELPPRGTFPEWCPLQEAEEGMYLEPK